MIDQRWVGKRTERSFFTISREEIRAYCAVIGEKNPIYLHVETAHLNGYEDVLIPPTYPSLFWQKVTIPWIEQDALLLQREQSFSYQKALIANKQYGCEIVLRKIRNHGAKQYVVHDLFVTNAETTVLTSAITFVVL